jgi:hypothetical protein
VSRAIPDAISYKTALPVRQFITSGSANENVPDESVFRQQFVAALTSDEGDSNKDGYITGTELGEFLQTSVTNYTRNAQHPQYGKIRNPNLDKGDFVFKVKEDTDRRIPDYSTVPQVLRTKKFANFGFHGLYVQWNASYGKNTFLSKLSLFYSTEYLNNRYCVGIDLSRNTLEFAQSLETFPGLIAFDTTIYAYYSVGLYNRLYLFPQNVSVINLYAGSSISWNHWQFELGLRPYLAQRFIVELQSSYNILSGEVIDRTFTYLGNSVSKPRKNSFRNFYFGLNLQYLIRFK